MIASLAGASWICNASSACWGIPSKPALMSLFVIPGGCKDMIMTLPLGWLGAGDKNNAPRRWRKAKREIEVHDYSIASLKLHSVTRISPCR